MEYFYCFMLLSCFLSKLDLDRTNYETFVRCFLEGIRYLPITVSSFASSALGTTRSQLARCTRFRLSVLTVFTPISDSRS